VDDEIPIYRYTVTLEDGTEKTTDAISYIEDAPWLIFNDHLGTVLTIRINAVASISRGPQVASAPVETL
jgi:hypothetical protein